MEHGRPGYSRWPGRPMDSSTSAVERIFKEERGRILATLIRILGDFDEAEEALAMALEAALAQWPRDGLPDNPRAWLIRAARNKAADRARHAALAERKHEELAQGDADAGTAPPDELAVEDDRLRLIFTCCHPAIAIEAQVALTLRTLGGLSTEEIARAFLVPAVAMAQRLVRVKQKIRGARIPYSVPAPEDLPERVEAVTAVIYLIFNEGYAATSGDALVRRELAAEAIRLGRLLCALLPTTPSPQALLALMLLHDSRRDARLTPDGEMVLLEDQDRFRWNQAQIAEGMALVESALRAGPADRYALQAAIAAEHARAARPADTDWRAIARLYARLFPLQPTPVVMLNHAVAIAMADGPAEGLRLLDQLAASGLLADYHLLAAARADLLRRLDRHAEAAAAYREALALVGNEPERRFLARRLEEVEKRVAAAR
jgi:RNA polymerase sigma-70 factor, ECF subfamily